MKIEAKYQPSAGRDRPWLAYINGVMLRSRAGVGRRFKTERAALAAAKKATGGAR